MDDIFVAVVSMLLVVSLIPLYLWRRRQASQSDDDDDHEHVEPPQVRQRETVVRGPAASRRMRRRPASGASSSSAPPPVVEEVGAEADDGSDEDAAEGEYYNAKASKKKGKKRQEREAQRQAEEAARESRHTKQDRYAEMRRRKDEEHEARERMLEEEAMARKAKEEEAAALEFEKWKGEFSVDAEGTTENDLQDGSQGLLFDFVEYIKVAKQGFYSQPRLFLLVPVYKKQKCVPLEDLAAEFKLRTQDCINRIISLEDMGRLSGVMDDRGKYVYISLEEMQAVADYIKRKGRVSISHLASQSNQFIDLEPKPQLIEDLSIVEEEISAT